MIVGAPDAVYAHLPAGKAFVLSGRTGLPVWSDGGNAGDSFGAAVAGIGDVDADGFDDLVASTPGRTTRPTQCAGVRPAGAGDADGDGIADLIVGAPSSPLGDEVMLFAGGGLFLHLNPTPVGSPRTYDYPSANLVASGGVAGNPAVVFLRSVNGVPLVYALANGLHGVDGAFSLRLPLEPLRGFDLAFGAADLDAAGRVRLSNPLHLVQR